MAKKIETYIKLQVPAGKANPSPPVGPALGQHGVNIMEFCKQFNAQTQGMEAGIPVPVVITVYSDRSFTFIMKTPPATVLLKKAAGIEKGSGTPNTEQGRQGHAQAARGDREDQDAGLERGGPRRGRPHHRGQRPQHGRRGGGLCHGEGTKAQKAGTEKVKPGKAYAADDALKLVKEFANGEVRRVRRRRDQPRHRRRRKSDQDVRGSTVLPNGNGKKVRVAVFTQGANAEAREAGRRRHRRHGRPRREDARAATWISTS